MTKDEKFKIQDRLDDSLLADFRQLFSKQIRYDKKHNNLNSKDFSGKGCLVNYPKVIKNTTKSYQGVTESLSDALVNMNLEDGSSYKKDIEDENDPQSMDSNYQKWIAEHQSHFSRKCMYNIADDIDFYTSPLTHSDVWQALNYDSDFMTHVKVVDAL